MSAPPAVFTDLTEMVGTFVQRHGWTFVAAGVLYLCFRDNVRSFLTDRKHKVALKVANDPERVKLLESERRRIRAEQQATMLEASAEAAAEKAKAKVARQEATKSNKPSTSTSGDHNPLMGGGGISGFTPTGNMRRQGRGG